MFPEEMVAGMREELTRVGFREMRTPAEVDSVLKQEKGTVLVVVNSVCGCAAGKARPAIAKRSLEQSAPGSADDRLRGAGSGSNAAGANLLHGIRAVVPLDRTAS